MAETRAETAEAENKKVSHSAYRLLAAADRTSPLPSLPCLFLPNRRLLRILRSRPLSLQINQTLLERDQEIASLQHKLALAEEENDKSEQKIKELKSASDEGESHRTTGENLARKVQLLEEELDKAEKDLKETTEK